jgi:coenzyme F420-reducing hydrogenase beta subunit
MINFAFDKWCYSCTACKTVCPKNAITYDELLLPMVDNEKCIGCGLCEKICIKLQEKSYNPQVSDIAEGYVCKSVDEEIRKNSSSGGVFYHLASQFIAKGGYVCGCVYDNDFMPKHILTNNLNDVKRMMGSKYVQSDLRECLIEIKRILKENKKVLFSGVPCQIAAVKAFVGNYTENLFLVGIVCHGSIDRRVWKSYLIAETNRGQIQSVTMRDKSKGWRNYGLKFGFKDGSEHITYRKQDGYFLKCFTDGILERDRCLNCNYKGNRIFADILLGDGWGMDKVFPEMDDSYGISAVICLTEKGVSTLQNICNKLEIKNISVQKILNSNPRIVSSPPENLARKKFQKEYMNESEMIQGICRKYATPTFAERIKKKIIAALKQ